MTKRMIRPLTEEQLFNRLGWQYKADVEKKGCEFVKTENLRSQLRSIARLMYGNRRWGLLIRGPFGNGKTTAVEAIKHVINRMTSDHFFGEGDIYEWEWMRNVSAREMVSMFIHDRDEGGFTDIKRRRWLAIDDVGNDPAEITVYGTKFYPFLELIDYRYEHRLPTVISTNLKKEEIIRHYEDGRLADRINEMFNAITFRDKSFRK